MCYMNNHECVIFCLRNFSVTSRYAFLANISVFFFFKRTRSAWARLIDPVLRTAKGYVFNRDGLGLHEYWLASSIAPSVVAGVRR